MNTSRPVTFAGTTVGLGIFRLDIISLTTAGDGSAPDTAPSAATAGDQCCIFILLSVADHRLPANLGT